LPFPLLGLLCKFKPSLRHLYQYGPALRIVHILRDSYHFRSAGPERQRRIPRLDAGGNVANSKQMVKK
jgi:hypothetical protein